MKRNIARLPLEVPYEMSSSFLIRLCVGHSIYDFIHVTPFWCPLFFQATFGKPILSLPNYPGYTYCISNWNTIGYSNFKKVII